MGIEERLGVLEKELKKSKVMNRWLMGALGLAVFLGMGGAAFSDSRKIIRANAISILDDQGRSRIALGVDSDGPLVALYGENEKTIASLAVTRGGPALSIFNSEGKLCVGLGVNKDKNMMILFGEKSEPGVVLEGSDKPSMAMFDENGKSLWTAK